MKKYYLLQLILAAIAVGFFASHWGPWLSSSESMKLADLRAVLVLTWVAFPYLLISLLLGLNRNSQIKSQILSIISVVNLASGLYYLVYNNAMRDGLAGILFLTVPIYQVVFIIIANILIWLFFKYRLSLRRLHKADNK